MNILWRYCKDINIWFIEGSGRWTDEILTAQGNRVHIGRPFFFFFFFFLHLGWKLSLSYHRKDWFHATMKRRSSSSREQITGGSSKKSQQVWHDAAPGQKWRDHLRTEPESRMRDCGGTWILESWNLYWMNKRHYHKQNNPTKFYPRKLVRVNGGVIHLPDCCAATACLHDKWHSPLTWCVPLSGMVFTKYRTRLTGLVLPTIDWLWTWQDCDCSSPTSQSDKFRLSNSLHSATERKKTKLGLGVRFFFLFLTMWKEHWVPQFKTILRTLVEV
jgi:hypothetical protein